MIGIDTARISRIAKSIKNEAFTSRVFTKAEIEYCQSRKNAAESFAGLFCAKEAAAKAIGCGFGTGLMPRDIEVAHSSSGAPILRFNNAAAKIFCGLSSEVSISHDGDYAVAVVLLNRINAGDVT